MGGQFVAELKHGTKNAYISLIVVVVVSSHHLSFSRINCSTWNGRRDNIFLEDVQHSDKDRRCFSLVRAMSVSIYIFVKPFSIMITLPVFFSLAYHLFLISFLFCLQSPPFAAGRSSTCLGTHIHWLVQARAHSSTVVDSYEQAWSAGSETDGRTDGRTDRRASKPWRRRSQQASSRPQRTNEGRRAQGEGEREKMIVTAAKLWPTCIHGLPSHVCWIDA